MSARRAAAVLLALAVLAGAVACKGSSDEAGGLDKPPPMSPTEIQRADDACKAYLDRLCGCAKARPADAALADRCTLKESKRSAIKMLLEIDKTDQASPAELYRVQDEIRKIVAKCIAEDNALDREGCPRLGAAPAVPAVSPALAPPP